jgi:membrane-bound ClpP family serine protease
MVGTAAVADESFTEAVNGEYTGMVHTHGELWRAISTGPVSEGETVEIYDREGLTLYVKGSEAPEQTT